MAIKEKATKQIVINALEPQVIGSNTTTTGAIVDMADYDNGIYFAVDVGLFTDGVYTLKLEDGDDSGLSDAADIPAAQLVYGSLPAPAAAIAEGAALPKEGIFGNKRYVRASIVSTGVTTGATVSVKAIVDPEIAKTPQDSL